VRERECVFEREIERVCVCVYERERERECVCERERDRVCETERASESESGRSLLPTCWSGSTVSARWFTCKSCPSSAVAAPHDLAAHFITEMMYLLLTQCIY